MAATTGLVRFFAFGTPLTVHQVGIRKLADYATVFDLTDWSGADGYLVNIESGEFDASPY